MLTSGAIVLNWVALGFADMSVLQPLNGFGLVVLAICSRALLGERLTRLTSLGMGVVLIGLVGLGLQAAPSRAWAETAAVQACYVTPTGAATLASLLGLILGGWALASRSARGAGVLFAFVAAASSVLGLTCAKGLFVGIGLDGLATSLTRWATWALAAPLLGFSTLAIMLQQLSFQKGRAVVVTPVFGATSVVLPLATGALVFGEPVGVGTVVAAAVVGAGVALLGQTGPQDAAAPALAPSET